MISFNKRKNEDKMDIMIRRALLLMIVCGVVAFSFLIYRLFMIQVINHEKYERAAVEQQLKEEICYAERGTIYDINGNPMALSVSSYNLIISPVEVRMNNEDIEQISAELSDIINVDYDSILNTMRIENSWYEVLAVDIENNTQLKIKELIDNNDYRGIRLEETTKRFYPYSSLASNVIGFVGLDDYGMQGVEASYDEDLAGVNGRIVNAATAAGDTIMFSDLSEQSEVIDGKNLILTLDATIEYYLEKNIEEAIDKYQVQNGAVGIVMNVNSGAILAMASYDNYDLNNYLEISENSIEKISTGTDAQEEIDDLISLERIEQWNNKAVSYTYEPGSTFKVLTLAMALEENAINTESTFECEGYLNVLGRDEPVICSDNTAHGIQTVSDAFMNSCNIAFVQIGQLIGAEKFYKYIDSFGLFDITGIDLPNESDSIWWESSVFMDENNKAQLASASFGQTFNITPIQMITAFSATVNGGYLMKPHIVSEIVSEDGEIAEKNEPIVVRRVLSEDTSRKCCEILEYAVEEEQGSGHNAFISGYRIGGKTGTSLKTSLKAETGEEKYIVSFIAVAPVDDPEIALLIILDEPSEYSGYNISGGNMAATTAAGVLSEILPYLGIEYSKN